MARVPCNICGAKRLDEFGGRKYAICPNCKSLERQRAWVELWNTSLASEIPIAGKTALVIAPFEADKMFFSGIGMKYVTLDIRPEINPDIVMDLCAESTLEDGAYDLIHCSHVFPHLYDLDKALANIERAMSPQAVFFSQNPAVRGRPTEEFSEDAIQQMPMKGVSKKNEAALMAKKDDLLKTKRVGLFRKFGDLGLLRTLQERFITRTFDARDPVSFRASTWIAGWKKSAADIVRDLPAQPTLYATPGAANPGSAASPSSQTS